MLEGFLTLLLVGRKNTSPELLLVWNLCASTAVRVGWCCFRGHKYFLFDSQLDYGYLLPPWWTGGHTIICGARSDIPCLYHPLHPAWMLEGRP